MAIQEFAKKMYSAYKLRLRTVEYPPFFLTFQQCTAPRSASLTANRKLLVHLLKDLFLREKGVGSSQLEYQISIQTGQSDTDYRSCHCFHLSNEDYDKYGTRQSRFPSSVEERFQSVEEELSHQKQLIANQFDEQQRQHDDISASLTKIVESLSRRNKDSKGNVYDDDDNDSPKFEPLLITSKSCSPNGLEHQNGESDETAIREEKLTEDRRDDKNTTDDARLKSVDEMTDQGTKLADIKGHFREQTVFGCSDESDFSQDSKVNSKRENKSCFQKSSAFETEEDQRRYSSENRRSSPEPAELAADPTTLVVSEGDRSSDAHDQTSSYLGHRYKSSSNRNSRYWDLHQGSQQASSGNDMKTLELPTDVYYSPHMTTQPYMNQEVATGSGGGDYVDSLPGILAHGGYYTSAKDPFPDIQTDKLNFNLRRTNQLFTVETERTPEVKKKERPWESSLGRQKLRLMIECMIGDSSNWKRLSESCEEAMLEDEAHVPKVEKAMDTVLCLDTSGSMAGDAFEKLKKITREFIDGVEAIAEKHYIEENIAIVTFGGRAKVIHHLSNDYGSLREALDGLTSGGPSPILESLVVSMACLTNGGVYHIDKNLKLPPRFVFLSDGNPTRTMREDAQDTFWIGDQEQMQISQAFGELSSRQLHDRLPSPVIFVPVGSYVTMACLETLAANSGGLVTSAESFPKMCTFQRLQIIAADALRCFLERGIDMSIFQTGFHDFISQLGYDVSASDATQIYEIVKTNVEKVVIHYGSKYSFYNIHEDHESPPLGSRVVRGPDWKWGNQDTEGAGTIFNHSRDKMVWVCWDNDHVNVYRYGYNGNYDIVTVDDQPRVVDTCAPDIGVQVQRGPDWHRLYEDQDDGRGHYGVIIRTNQLGKVMVRWQNGHTFVYRYGYMNRFDVVVRDPIASIIETSRMELDAAKIQGADKDRTHEWERKDSVHGWESYSPENTAKLKKAYLKNPFGSCLIQRNGQSCRVSFKALTERSIKDRVSVPVRLHILKCKFFIKGTV